jgi:outer membrane protein OmpA-like peptidoglycan-associated protein
LSEEYISYKSGGKNQLRMFPDLSERKGLERWEIEIADSRGKTVKNISGGGSVPAFADWNCKDENGNELADGNYFVTFRAWFISGNNPESYAKRIIFDSTPPVAALSHDPELFSPDDDGENDMLAVKITASDNTGIDSWTLKIQNESKRTFKTFSGMGTPPEKIIWDGTGDSRELVESASDYFMEITAFDMAGNVSETASEKFAVDVLVVVTERGLKMRISNIEFAFGSAALGKRGTKILDRVAVILERYSRYNVVIEGHTDDIGNDDYNRKLSERRALSVRDYLIKKGIDPSRMQYEGLGESMPFYPNTNDENRKRNRRVEFLLLKDKE